MQSPGIVSESDTPLSETAAKLQEETQKPVKHRFELIIEWVDANTLRMSDVEAESRPTRFDDQAVVLHRQGVAKAVQPLR